MQTRLALYGGGASRAERDLERHQRDMAEAARIAWEGRAVFDLSRLLTESSPAARYQSLGQAPTCPTCGQIIGYANAPQFDYRQAEAALADGLYCVL